MNILYIITQGEQGGGQKNVFDLASSFSSVGDAVSVATGVQKKESDKWLTDSLSNYSEKIKTFEIKNLVREINIKSDSKAFFEIKDLIRKINPEVVHLHSTKAGMIGSVAAKLSGKKVVYTVHGFVFKEPMNLFKKIIYIICELIASFFIDKYICVSENDLQIGKRFFIIRGRRGSVIYNGIDEKVELYSKVEAKNEVMNFFNLSSKFFEGKKVIGSISNLYKTKGLGYFIRAARLLNKDYPNLLFIVFGEGEERKLLENEIAREKINNIFLLGKLPNASKYIKLFDIFVMSSVKEGFPYAPVEASLGEVPVVSTNVGGLPEMAKYINIKLVEPKNATDLRDKISEVLDNKIINKFSDEFSIKNMINKTSDIYRHVIN